MDRFWRREREKMQCRKMEVRLNGFLSVEEIMDDQYALAALKRVVVGNEWDCSIKVDSQSAPKKKRKKPKKLVMPQMHQPSKSVPLSEYLLCSSAKDEAKRAKIEKKNKTKTEARIDTNASSASKDITSSGPLQKLPYGDSVNQIMPVISPHLDSNNNVVRRKFVSVASFNWFGDPQYPVLIMPGRAKRYDVEWERGQLALDSGRKILNENHYMLEQHTMDSFFHAIQTCAQLAGISMLNYQEYDIATDATNLDKLFSLVTNRFMRDSSFVIEVERVGRLIIFNVCEQADYIDFNENCRSYGLDFEKRCSEAPSDKFFAGSFYQINSMRFGSLNLLIGTFMDCADCDRSTYKDNKDFADETFSNVPGSKLKIIRRGCAINYCNTELITRRHSMSFPYHKYANWFFSDVQTVDVGFQDNGFIQRRIQHSFEEITEMLERGESSGILPSKNMPKLNCLLMKVVNFVRGCEEGKKFALHFGVDTSGKIETVELPNTAEESCISPYVRQFVGGI